MSAKIWIVLQHRDGKLHRMSREALVAGRRLADAVGGTPEAVLLGSGLEGLGQEVAGLDVAKVLVADHTGLAEYTPGAYGGALAAAVKEAGPAYLVFPHTYQSVDYFPRLAQSVDGAVVPEVTALAMGEGGLEFTRPILGGKLVARVRPKGDGPVLLSVQSGAFSASELGTGAAAVEELPGDRSAVAADREILGVEEVGADTIDLSKADAIVAVGRGVGGEDKLGPAQELAKVLGAEIGASRPVIDSGWLARELQIGSSGQTVAPKLYIALGISGAIQHLVGMKGAGTVVAINKDPGAPIFGVSDYGLVGDLHEIVPALIQEIAAAKGG